MNASYICSGDERVDPQTFQSHVARVAGGLETLGVGAGDRVALLLRNGVAFVEITIAVGRLGAFAVPINWHFTRGEIDLLLDDCQPSVIFVDEDLIGSLSPQWFDRTAIIRVPGAAGVDLSANTLAFCAWRDAAPPSAAGPRLSPGSIVYTSGTTGCPKGVKRVPATPDQARAMAEVRAQLYRLSPEDRVLVPGPLYHAFPNQLATSAAATGAHLEIMARFDAEEVLRIIERERITSIGLAPIMFVRLLRLSEAVRRAYDLSSLRWAVHAGGPCAPDAKQAMLDWWGPIIAEYYGGTETGPLTLCTGPEWLSRRGSVGRPIKGARIRIVDESGNDVAPGSPGEIFGRLDAYPDFTYHNDPEKRRSVALGDLVSLGDIGYQDEDGYLYLCDRARDMIVSGGVNIYPAEVEGALLSLANVADCAVFGVPDAEFGESVVAYIVGTDMDEATLRQGLRERIAGYKVPREIVIVSELNRDPSGKLRKQSLREQYLARSMPVP